MSDPNYVELNGQLLPPENAAVPTTDLGLLYGIGFFETMRAYRGRVFRLRAHVERLAASAAQLGIAPPNDVLPDEARVTRLLEANGLSDARLRLTVTGGRREQDCVRHSVLLTATEIQPYPVTHYTVGATVRVCSQIQDSHDVLQGHKTTCYWPRLQVLHEAQLQGCMEALWLNERQQLAEGSISNLFVVRGGTVLTPPLDTPVLPGVTRAAVLALCREDGIPARETALTIHDLLDADEVFLTNCMMAVVPVVRVERRAIADEKPGDITRRLSADYERLVARECPDR